MKTTRAFLVSILLLAQPKAVLAAAPACDLDAREVVAFAQKRGYRFEITRISANGNCTQDNTSSTVFTASATSSDEVVCKIVIFRKSIDTTPAPTTLPADAVATTPAAPAWVIASIRIAPPGGAPVYAEQTVTATERSWTFPARAAKGETEHYRIDRIELTTQKDCKLWQEAF